VVLQPKMNSPSRIESLQEKEFLLQPQPQHCFVLAPVFGLLVFLTQEHEEYQNHR
jgi:hypothetical protein